MFLAIMAMITVVACTSSEEAPDGPKETIILADLEWRSAQLQNRIAQYLVEFGYGYPTDVKFGSTLPSFEDLENGAIQVSMEIWLPNQEVEWGLAIAEGSVPLSWQEPGFRLAVRLCHSCLLAGTVPGFGQRRRPEGTEV